MIGPLISNFHNREEFIGTIYAGLYDHADHPQAYEFDEDLVTCYPNNNSPGNYVVLIKNLSIIKKENTSYKSLLKIQNIF